MLNIKALLIPDERLPVDLREAIASDQPEAAAGALREAFDLSCGEVREVLDLPALEC